MPELTHLEINITSKCDLKCEYCANLEPFKSDSLLKVEDINDIFDSFIGSLEFVSLTGGEPTLEIELTLNIIKEAKKRNLKTQLNTHGFNLTNEMITNLKNAGLDIFHISYNCTERNLDIRGISLEQLLLLDKNIRTILNETDCRVYTEAILYKNNCEYFPEIYRKCWALGVHEFQIQPLMPCGRASKYLQLEPAKLTKTINALYSMNDVPLDIRVWCCYVRECDRVSDLIYSILDDNGKPKYKKNIYLSTGCREGWSRLHIHNNGDILICDLIDFGVPLGNIYKDDIVEIFNFHPTLLNIRNNIPSNCEDCNSWNKCHNVCVGDKKW